MFQNNNMCMSQLMEWNHVSGPNPDLQIAVSYILTIFCTKRPAYAYNFGVTCTLFAPIVRLYAEQRLLCDIT